MKTALIILTILLATSGTPAAEQAPPADLHAAWDVLLQKHVSDGNVDYKAFQRSEAQLDAYLATLGATDPSSLSRNGQLAYWINAYNAFTLKLILNHYPVKSIRKLERPWKQRFWMAAGKMHSLDQIEHAILRRKFKEPRIHFAIVCAIVKVLPLPVTPIRVWHFLPARNCSTSLSIACGWSPAGAKSLTNLNSAICSALGTL